MCGIYGAAALAGAPLRNPATLRRMGDLLLHRGPDSGGSTESPDAVLGARRLAILDLHEDADQPFVVPGRALWIVCNGEIYNAPELRRHYAARGYDFRSQRSDIEPLLPLFLEYGEAAVARIEGMFALALWDAQNGRLLLARDRAGEKPLFYSQVAGELRFASEIQVLLSLAGEQPEVCPAGLADYLTLGYAVAPRTLFRGVRKLEAGQLLVADAEGVALRRYWSAAGCAMRPRSVSRHELRETLEGAVRRQIVADVPVGVFTSGGLDSSLLAVEAVRHLGAAAVHTYAARFETASFDESDWAEQLCRTLGTRHRTVTATRTELLRALDVVRRGMAEPLGDPAILPTYLLSEAAGRDVKVILSGEGADELFGGYPTYLGHRWAERFGALPRPLRDAIVALVRRIPVTHSKVSLEFLARRFVDEATRPPRDRHLAWFGALGGDAPDYAVHPQASPAVELWSQLEEVSHPIKRAMIFDLMTYLAENLLTKVDRATMLASVEARAPFLDRSVMEAALGQPVSAGVGALTTKRALKRAARGLLPRAIVVRRKRGLSVPVAEWLNGAMRSEIDQLLAPERLQRQQLLHPEAVARLLSEHRAGRADHARRIWPLVVLQYWYDQWIRQPPS